MSSSSSSFSCAHSIMSNFSVLCSVILFVLLIYIHSTRGEDEEWLQDEYIPPPPNKKSEEETSQVSVDSDDQLGNLTIKWDQLSWKTLCDDEEWRRDFEKVRRNLTRCLELTKILLPEDKEEEVDDSENLTKKMSLMFSEGKSNPYCRMSRNWVQCHHYLKDITCLDPNPTPLLKRGSGYSHGEKITKYLPVYPDPNEWIYMHRAYKMMCLMAKMTSKYNPFNLMFGGGFF